MNHLWKRSLSLIMAIFMVLSLIPANPVHVHASEVDGKSASVDLTTGAIVKTQGLTVNTTAKANGTYNVYQLLGGANIDLSFSDKLVDDLSGKVVVKLVFHTVAYHDKFEIHYANTNGEFVKFISTSSNTKISDDTANELKIVELQIPDAGLTYDEDGVPVGLRIKNNHTKALAVRSITVIERYCDHNPGAAADCLNDQVCLDCRTVITPAQGHAWGNWTSNEDGTHSRVCTTDASHTENGDCNESGTDGACSECGYKVPAVEELPEYVVLPEGVTVESFGADTVTDGTYYYATLVDALTGIHLTGNRVLYCKPGADVGKMTHGHVCDNLTVYGNGASVTGGEQDFEIGQYKYCHNGANVCQGITDDLTLTVKYLNGSGAWGNRSTDDVVNLVFENCQDMGRIYINGIGGENHISLTDCSFTSNVAGDCKVYSNANGSVKLTRVAFSNVNVAVNLNHKVAGTQIVEITDCSFTNCGYGDYDYAAPVRVLSSVEGGESELTVSGCTFTGTIANKQGQTADILLDYGVGTTNATVNGTAANVTVEAEENVGTETVIDNKEESKDFTNVVETPIVPSAEISNLTETEWTVSDEEDREAFNVQLKKINAANSLVVEVYHNEILLTTTELKDSLLPVVNSANNSEGFNRLTVNIVLWGRASSSWDTRVETANLTEDNIPNYIKVYSDGVLVADGERTFDAAWIAAYKGLDSTTKSEVKVATLTELQEALASDSDLPIVITETIEIPAGQTVTLDLNGKTVTVPEAASRHIYALNNKGILTIKDSKGNGSISARGIYNGYNGNTEETVAGAKMIIESGKFIALDTNGGAAIFNCAELVINGGEFVGSVAAVNNRTMGETTINSGTYTSSSSYAIQNNGGKLTINDATATSAFGAVGTWGGETTIKGGSYTVTSGLGGHAAFIGGGSLIIENGTFNPFNGTNGCSYSVFVNESDVTVEIKNGLFGVGSSNDWMLGVAATVTNSKIAVSGGQFATEVKDQFLAEGYEFDSTTGTVVASKVFVAEVNGTQYESLEAAIAAAEAGDTITLINNAVISNNNGYGIMVVKAITIDGNGKTITVGEGYSNEYALLYLYAINGTVTIKNLTFDGVKSGAAVWAHDADLVIDNCVFQNGNHTQVQGLVRTTTSNLTVKNSKFLNNNCNFAITFNYDAAENDTMIVEGCEFSGNTVKDTAVIYYVDGASSTIKNSSFVNNTIVSASHGAVLYYSNGANGTVTGNIFSGNSITAAGARASVLALEAGTTATGNVFTGNTFSSSASGTTYVATVLNKADEDTAGVVISANYWNGGEPDYIASKDAPTEIENYYTTYVDGVMGGLTKVASFVAEVNGVEYESLQAAINAANGQTVTLLADIVLNETVTVPVSSTVTLDLNGKSISMQESILTTVYAINNLGTLTLKDSVGTGSVNARGIYNGYGNGGDNVPSAKLIVESGTYNAMGTNGGAAIFNYGIVEITGGTFTSVGGYSLNNQNGASMTVAGATANNGIYNSGATLTINGGNISGNRSGCHVIYAWNSNVTINGGEFYNNNSGNATVMADGSSQLTINDGTFGIKDGRVPGNGNTWTSCLTDTAKTATMTVNGGTFNGGFRVQAGTTMTINGGSYNDCYGSKYNINGTVTVKGGSFTDETAKSFATKYLAEGYELGEDGNVVASKVYVAQIGEQKFETLAAAVAAVKEGETITILAGTIEEGTIKLPANLNNVTIKGSVGTVLKDTVISAADGNSYSYVNLTFDGLTFDNGGILFTGWRNGDEIIKDLTITNCVFKNLNNDSNTAPIHINKDASEAVENFTFTNNVIDGATGGSKSGVYAQLTGKVVFTGNVINNVSFRPYVIQLTNDDGIADEFIVTGNTFSGSAVGRAQGLGSNAEGTDTVKLVVSENIFKGITDSQQICYWNFNAVNTTADLSKNYYDIDIVANPSRIYFNSAAASVDDLVEKGVYPYYTELNEDGTINVESLVEAPAKKVAEVDGVGYATLEEAVAAAQAGDEIILLADVTLSETLTLPAGITFNGNGKSITGEVWAGGNLTFVGHTKVTNFNAGYDKPVITIGAGATLELTGTGRMVLGHGATFNITGNITDAKTANVAELTPSLIAAGASFTGAGLNFNVTNAYVKFTAYCSSKNSSANGTFNINVTNSIWEQSNTLVFTEPTNGKDPTFNFTVKDSVLNSTSHLVFGVTKGEIVFDNSNINVGANKQLENRSTLTIKNGSVVYASHATSSNAKNPGTTIVDNATYVAIGEFSGADVGTGTLILKKGADVTMGTITKANIVVDATGMAACDVIGLTANLSKLAGTLSVTNNDKLEAKIVDGKIVLAAKPVATVTDAQGNVTYCATLEEAIAAAQDGETVTLLADVVLSAGITVNKSFSFTLDGNGHSITAAEGANLGYQAVYFCGNAQGTYTIENLTFEGFDRDNVSALILRLEDAGKFELNNVTFDNCDVAKGADTTYAMVRVYKTDMTATGLTMTNCKGGMLMDIGPSSDDFVGKIEIINSKFENNEVMGTALIYSTLVQAEDSYLAVSGTTFKNNVIGDATATAAQGRGVIHLGSDAKFENCTFDGNTVYGSHANNISFGINEYSGYDWTVTGCTFANSAVYQTNAKVGPVAGAAVMAVGNVTLTDCTVEDNNKFYHRADATAQYVEQEARSVGTYSNSYGTTTIVSGTYNGALITYKENEGFAVSGGTFTVAIPEEYCAEGFVPTENADGTYGVKVGKFVAQVGEQKFETLAEAVTYAKDQGMTDLTIVLIGETTKESAIALDDSLNLYTQTIFNSVTLKQADASKVYYIAGLYTGSRVDGGNFILDGVNILVTDQYIFEGNVVLTNNSIVKSVAEANCFIYNGTTTVEPGSKLYGVIEDFRGGDMIVDGGRTDGTYNTEADVQDAIMHIRWSGDKLILKNGAYVNVNAVNEVGKLNLSAGTTAELTASRLDAWEYIDVAAGAEIRMDVASLVNTKVLKGSGKIIVDAAGFTGTAAQIIKADMSGFTGTVEIINSNDAVYEITESGLNIVAREPSGKVAYRGYVNNSATRNAVQIDLENVYAKESLVIELYDAQGNLLTTTSLKAGAVDAASYTCNIVLWGSASGSWNTVIHAEKLTVANAPATIKVIADGVVTDVYENALGDKYPEYYALPCIYKAAKVGNAYFATLAEAIAAAKDGDEIDLLVDLSLSEILTITKAITLDGNGHTLTSTAKRAINVTCEGEVTIKNLTIIGAGNCERGINVLDATGITNIENVTVTVVGTKGTMIAVNAFMDDGNTEKLIINIKNSTLTAGYYAVQAYADCATYNIENSVLTGWAAIKVCEDYVTVNVTNSELIGINPYPADQRQNEHSTISITRNCTGTDINVTGGSITAKSEQGLMQAIFGHNSPANAEVVLDSELILIGEGAKYLDAAVSEIAVSVRAEYADGLRAEGYAVVTANGMTTAVVAVASVNGNYYATLAEAIAAANGGEVEVLRDVTEELTAIQNVTLTTNVAGGVTITNTATDDEWIAFENVTIGSDVTLISANVMINGTYENVIEGTLIAGLEGTTGTHFYQCNDAKTTIRNGGKVIVNGDVVLRYNDEDGAGIFIYGDNNAETVEFSTTGYIGAYSGAFYAENAVVTTGTELRLDYHDIKNGVVKGEEADKYDPVVAEFVNSTVNVTGQLRLYKDAHLVLTNSQLTAGVVQTRQLARPVVTIDSASSIKATAVEPVPGTFVDAILNADGTVSFKPMVAQLGTKTYSNLQAAIDAAQADDTIELLADIDASEVILIGKSLTINGNDHEITSSATRIFRITTGNVQVTMNDLSMVSTAVRTGNVDSIRGISIDAGLTNVKLTLNDCSVDFTDATATDYSYAVNISGSGTGHTVTINGGSYEAANVINLWGNDHQVDVDGAVLTSIYGPNEQFHGAIVRVEGQIAKLEMTNNTFNGDHAKVVSYDSSASCDSVIDENNIDNTKRYVVKVGNTLYHTLEEAIAAANADETITLLANVNIDKLIKIEKAITLDLNGMKVTATSQKAFEIYADATIMNGTIEAAQRCVDTRKAVELTLTDVNLIADKYTTHGNPQPLTIGGSENGTKVTMTDVNISAAAGYGIITFVKTELTATGSTISGYNALYVKPGSEESVFNFADCDLIGSTASNDVEGNSFSTIAVRADDVTVNVDASSTVSATGNYCWAISLDSTFPGESGITGANITVAGAINGKVLNSADVSKNTITVKAEYADELQAAGYGAVIANGMATAVVAVASVNGTYYATLAEAVEAANEGDTITLLKGIVVEAGETLTLDKDVKIVYTSNVAGEDMFTVRGILNVAAGTITYVNTDTTGSNVTVSTISCEPGSVLNVTGGTIENKTVKADGSSIYSYAIDLLTNGNLGDVTVNISGGTIYSDYMAIRQFNNGDACKNTLNITGGYIFGAKRAVQVHIDNTAAYTTISGGKIEGGYALCFLTTSENVSVTGGEFIGDVWYSGTKGFISGGTFSTVVADKYIAEEHVLIDNGNETYTVKTLDESGYVAQNVQTGKYFATVSEALAAAKKGETVQLISDADESGNVLVIMKGITLDLNGFKLTADGLAAFKGNYVVDNSTASTGLLIVDKDALSLMKDNPELPFWNESNGYYFTKPVTGGSYQRFTALSEDGFTFVFRPSFSVGGLSAGDTRKQFIMNSGLEDNGIKMVLRLTWTGSQGQPAEQDFLYTEELIKQAYTSGSLMLSIMNLPVDQVDVKVILISDTGTEYIGITSQYNAQ